MVKKGSKFYVVWVGRNPGIYKSWDECQVQISEFEGARYKSFPTEKAATEAFRGNMWDYIGKKEVKNNLPFEEVSGKTEEIITDSLAVDAACSGNPGIMEYRGVYTKNRKQIFHAGPFKDGTNNVGEFLAIVHALALLKQKNKCMPVYTDSETAIVWVRQKKAKTKLKKTPDNNNLFELIQRAEKWLKNNFWDTPVLKWKTEIWGEIPADFGRK